MINQIGEWVLRTAFAQNVAWQQAGLPEIRVSVNLSAQQLREKEFPAKIADLLEEMKLSREWVELELTESALMMESANQKQGQGETLQMLAQQQIRLSIDDFGVGYSSLSYLRRFPFSALKIDRSFIMGIGKDQKAQAVVEGLIRLAHSLDLQVIARVLRQSDSSTSCSRINSFWLQKGFAGSSVGRCAVQAVPSTSVSGRTGFGACRRS